MITKLVLCFSFLCFGSLGATRGRDYQKAIKFLFDYKKTQLLVKVGLKTASPQEIEAVSGIVTQEYRKTTKAVERHECKIIEMIKLFIVKSFDLSDLLKAIVNFNRQLGMFLDEQLTLLKPIALLDQYKSVYGAISRKRDRLRPLEIDASSLLCMFFRKIASRELCANDLRDQFKVAYSKYSSGPQDKLDKNAQEVAHLTVLLKMLENPGKAISELSGKTIRELLEVAGTLSYSIATADGEVASSRKFLCRERDWGIISDLSNRIILNVESFLEESGDLAVPIVLDWRVELEFFMRGCNKLQKDPKAFIGSDKLLQAVLSGFTREDLACFYRLGHTTLIHRDAVRRRFTVRARMFFDLLVAIGMEQAAIDSVCQTPVSGWDWETVSRDAANLRAWVEMFVNQSGPVKDDDLQASVADMSSSVPTLPMISHPTVGKKVGYERPVQSAPIKEVVTLQEVNLDDIKKRVGRKRSYGMPVDKEVKRDILEALSQTREAYAKLTNITVASIFEYLSTHRNIDYLRSKVRLLAHGQVNKLRIFTGRYMAIQSSGSLKAEFQLLDTYKRGFEFASQNTCEFLSQTFKSKVSPILDFYIRKEDLFEAYKEYKKAYGEVTPQKLLSLQQKVFSAVLFVRVIVNPEAVFYETQYKQKESFLRMAGECYYGIYGQN